MYELMFGIWFPLSNMNSELVKVCDREDLCIKFAFLARDLSAQ